MCDLRHISVNRNATRIPFPSDCQTYHAYLEFAHLFLGPVAAGELFFPPCFAADHHPISGWRTNDQSLSSSRDRATPQAVLRNRYRPRHPHGRSSYHRKTGMRSCARRLSSVRSADGKVSSLRRVRPATSSCHGRTAQKARQVRAGNSLLAQGRQLTTTQILRRGSALVTGITPESIGRAA